MKLLSPLAFILSVASWVLLVLTFTNLLSGYLDERTCQTDCVMTYYFGSFGIAVASMILAIVALFSGGSGRLAGLSLVICLPVLAIVIGIFLIGNFGHLL